MLNEQAWNGWRHGPEINDESLLDKFVGSLRRFDDSILVDIDSPDNPNGEHWIDVRKDGLHLSLSFRPRDGFGFFTSDLGFGDRPDEIYRDANLAAKRALLLLETLQKQNAIEPIRLFEIRQLHEVTQTELADKLEIKQPSVARQERRRDFMVSTLIDFVEALGGIVDIRVKFRHFEAKIYTSSNRHRRHT